MAYFFDPLVQHLVVLEEMVVIEGRVGFQSRIRDDIHGNVKTTRNKEYHVVQQPYAEKFDIELVEFVQIMFDGLKFLVVVILVMDGDCCVGSRSSSSQSRLLG